MNTLLGHYKLHSWFPSTARMLFCPLPVLKFINISILNMAPGAMVQSAGLINDVTSIPPARMLRKLNSGWEPTMQFVVALSVNLAILMI